MPGTSRPDLNGLRVKLPGHPAIYLMDMGKKRHIPNPAVYNQIFQDWQDIVQDINIDAIEMGDPIPETAILWRCADSPKVFFLDGVAPNQTKRHVASPAVMDRYNFDWNKIHVWSVPLEAIGYPDGPQVRNP